LRRIGRSEPHTLHLPPGRKMIKRYAEGHEGRKVLATSGMNHAKKIPGGSRTTGRKKEKDLSMRTIKDPEKEMKSGKKGVRPDKKRARNQYQTISDGGWRGEKRTLVEIPTLPRVRSGGDMEKATEGSGNQTNEEQEVDEETNR